MVDTCLQEKQRYFANRVSIILLLNMVNRCAPFQFKRKVIPNIKKCLRRKCLQGTEYLLKI